MARAGLLRFRTFPIRIYRHFDGLRSAIVSSCRFYHQLSNRNVDAIEKYDISNKVSVHKNSFPSVFTDSCAYLKPCMIYKRDCASCRQEQYDDKDFLHTTSDTVREIMKKDMIVTFDFITEEEEELLFNEVEPHLKRQRYETSHWDDAIHGYREFQKTVWTEKGSEIIQRIRDKAFPPGSQQLSRVHILDLKKDGYIKPHVDAVKFCGSTIAGISLLSSSVMRLVNTEDKSLSADIFLKRRSMYIMTGDARYKFTHEILAEGDSMFNGEPVPRDRRISVICRNEP